ncbi:hypothetical protein FPOAC1_005021 [Fusarium poae]|uniref:hypothetical protein n=1 Tax=Fusarium poae TaxID=36050 RepID=UPI001CEBE5F2|nr:hypothetical protein FPOAC1_005021 [Fusarium poae]KAG8671763.1 hypothetical protein FPOAC1_005021 [Fusarium poae]
MLMPEVYIFDTTDNNEIITPSICMSFIPGETVSHVWLDETSRESLRLSILTRLVPMGAEDGTNFLGLVFDWDEQEDGSGRVNATRAYFSTTEYLACCMDFGTHKDSWSRAARKMTEALIQKP